MKTLKYFYKSIFAFFYDRLGSDKHTSDSASISVLALFMLIFIIVSINIIGVISLNINFLKSANEWIILIFIILLYLSIVLFLKKFVKN
jgi:hypothetical protein